MAEVRVETTHTTILTLTERETFLLKAYIQNPVKGTPSDVLKVLSDIYDALNPPKSK